MSRSRTPLTMYDITLLYSKYWNCISNGHFSMQLAPLYSRPSVLWWSFSASPSLNPAFVCLQQFFPCLFHWLHFFPFIILVHPLKRQAAHCTPPSLSTSLQFYCLLQPLGPSQTPAIDNGAHFFCEQLSTSPSGFPIIITVRKALKESKGENVLQQLITEAKFLRCNALWSGRKQSTIR
jgi:hypothetical protein